MKKLLTVFLFVLMAANLISCKNEAYYYIHVAVDADDRFIDEKAFDSENNNQDILIIKYRIEEVDESVTEKIKVGDKLYDDTYSLELGKVIDVEIDDSISYSQTDDENNYSITSKEGYKSMIITGECKGTKTKQGAEIGGRKYGVGHSFVLSTGDAKLYLRVYDIQSKKASE